VLGFEPSGVGCLEHADPECLCDVLIQQVLSVDYGSNVLFGALALQMIGSEFLEVSNIYRWAAVMLGMYDQVREVPVSTARGSGSTVRVGSSTVIRRQNGITPWMSLDKDVRSALNECARIEKLTWTEAKWIINDLDLTPEEVRYIAKCYNIRRYR